MMVLLGESYVVNSNGLVDGRFTAASFFFVWVFIGDDHDGFC